MFSGVDNNQQAKNNEYPVQTDSQMQQQMAMQQQNQNFGQQQQYQQPQGFNNNMMMQPQMGNQQMMNPMMQQQPMMMNQQQMMMPQAGMNAGMGMGMGMVYPQQQMMGVDPMDQQLLGMAGAERIRNVKNISIKLMNTAGCSDMICCGQFGSRFQINTVNMLNAQAGQPLFEIQFDEPGCGESNIEGRFYSIGNVSGVEAQKDHIYDVSHNRSCCALKCLCGWAHICGVINFYILTLLCPSSSKLKKDGSVLNKLEYGCCASSVKIYEGGQNVKYTLKASNQGQERTLIDGSGNAIYGFQCNTLYSGYGKHRRFISSNITFPDNFSPEDKAAVILGLCKSIS